MEVTVTYIIEPGKTFSISPSYGWEGIAYGRVVVTHVCDYNTLLTLPEAKDVPDIDGIVELDENAINEQWVVYKYAYTQDSDYMGLHFALTVDIFADHISSAG